MFERLAASLNIAFKWLPMFDLDQTFSSNIFHHEQMFDRLATSANKASPSGKKQPIRNPICVMSLQNFSGNTQEELRGLTLFSVWSNIVCSFSHPMLCATNTMFDENVWSFSRGFSEKCWTDDAYKLPKNVIISRVYDLPLSSYALALICYPKNNFHLL